MSSLFSNYKIEDQVSKFPVIPGLPGFQRDPRLGESDHVINDMGHENQIAPSEKAEDWDHLGTFCQLGMSKT